MSLFNFEEIVGIGNFGIEHLKIGKKEKAFLGGAGLRFVLFASLYTSLKVITIVKPTKKWEQVLNLLSKNEVDIKDVDYSDKEIEFYTSYDQQLNLLDFKIVNSQLMSQLTFLAKKVKLNKQTIVNISPLDFHSQQQIVYWAKKAQATISLQLHFSSLNKQTKSSYYKLIKLVDFLFINRKEALLLTKKKDLLTAGKKLSSLANGYLFITGDAQGVFLFKKGDLFWQASAIPLVKKVNLEGAGEAFNAGVIVGLTRLKDIKKAVFLGLITAYLSIQLESPEEVLKLFNYNIKNNIYNVS